MSYGLVLFGLVVLVPLVLTVRRRGWRRRAGPWLVALAGAVTDRRRPRRGLGFNWLTGLGQLRIRYYQGIAAQRPFSYFVYANLAAWLISCSPLLAVGIARSIGVLRRGRHAASPDQVVAWLALSGVLAAVIADLSALSKAETERIWLAFGAIAYSGLALLTRPARHLGPDRLRGECSADQSPLRHRLVRGTDQSGADEFLARRQSSGETDYEEPDVQPASTVRSP